MLAGSVDKMADDEDVTEVGDSIKLGVSDDVSILLGSGVRPVGEGIRLASRTDALVVVGEGIWLVCRTDVLAVVGESIRLSSRTDVPADGVGIWLSSSIDIDVLNIAE